MAKVEPPQPETREESIEGTARPSPRPRTITQEFGRSPLPPARQSQDLSPGAAPRHELSIDPESLPEGQPMAFGREAVKLALPEINPHALQAISNEHLVLLGTTDEHGHTFIHTTNVSSNGAWFGVHAWGQTVWTSLEKDRTYPLGGGSRILVCGEPEEVILVLPTSVGPPVNAAPIESAQTATTDSLPATSPEKSLHDGRPLILSPDQYSYELVTPDGNTLRYGVVNGSHGGLRHIMVASTPLPAILLDYGLDERAAEALSSEGIQDTSDLANALRGFGLPAQQVRIENNFADSLHSLTSVHGPIILSQVTGEQSFLIVDQVDTASMEVTIRETLAGIVYTCPSEELSGTVSRVAVIIE